MQDRPTDMELLQGVLYFLEDTAIPELDGAAKFRARVATNAVRMILREADGGESALQNEHQALAALLSDARPVPENAARVADDVREMTEELSRRIREGDADDGQFRRYTVAFLRNVVARKLDVTNPKLSAAIREEWRSRN